MIKITHDRTTNSWVQAGAGNFGYYCIGIFFLRSRYRGLLAKPASSTKPGLNWTESSNGLAPDRRQNILLAKANDGMDYWSWNGSFGLDELNKCYPYAINCFSTNTDCKTYQLLSKEYQLIIAQFESILRPVARSFDVFFDLHLNKCLSKQSCSWWFDTPSCSLSLHCNEITWHGFAGLNNYSTISSVS